MNTLNLELKSLTVEHLNAVLELDKTCFGGLWTLQGYQRELESPHSHLFGLFSPHLSSSRLLGMISFWSILEEAHITILAVNPQYHRQGLGQVLLYKVLRTVHERGMERATLEVRASNQGAITLYEKFGFKIAGRRRDYYKDKAKNNVEDALVLWRGNLQQPSFASDLEKWHILINSRLGQFSWKLVL